MNMRDSKVGVWEMVAAMALSGTLGLFVFESGQSAFNVVFFRCLFGALSLGAYCWWRGIPTRSAFSRTTLLMTMAGGVAIVFNWVLLFKSYGMASISISTAVYHTQPFFLVILGAILFRDAINIHKIGWLVVAFVGLMLVIKLDLSGASLSTEYVTGLMLALGAAVLYAVATIITKRLKGLAPHLIALVQVTLGIFLLLPFADLSSVPMAGDHWYYLVSLGVVHTCVMYILMYSAFQKLQTPVIAVLSFIYPAVAILVDYVFYDQDLALSQFAGIACILASSAGVNLGWRLLPRMGRASVEDPSTAAR